jgi:hypothetical protein
VIDLVKMKAIVWNGEELGAKFEEQDIPADLQELANEYREKMIDMIVEQDDAVSNADPPKCCSRRSIACACYISGDFRMGMYEQRSVDAVRMCLQLQGQDGAAGRCSKCTLGVLQ